LIGVHHLLAENAPAALVAALAVTEIATVNVNTTEAETGIVRRTRTRTRTTTGMIAIVRIGLEIAEIGTNIETRRRTTTVAAGAPTASAACRPPRSRKMTFLGPRLQSERVTVLACLLSVWIRAKNGSLLDLLLSVLLLNFGSVCVPKSLMCLCCAVGLYDSYFTVVA